MNDAFCSDPQHPVGGLLCQRQQPVLGRGYEPAVLNNMLFCQQFGRHSALSLCSASCRPRINNVPKFVTSPLHASAVVPKRPVSPVAGELLGFVKPLVQLDVIIGMAAILGSTALSVFVWRHTRAMASRPTLSKSTGSLPSEFLIPPQTPCAVWQSFILPLGCIQSSK